MSGCAGPVIYCDTIGLHVAKYRHVFSSDRQQRSNALRKLLQVFHYMERQLLDHVVYVPGLWPCFVKSWSKNVDIRKKLHNLRVPMYEFSRARVKSIARKQGAEQSTHVAKPIHDASTVAAQPDSCKGLSQDGGPTSISFLGRSARKQHVSVQVEGRVRSSQPTHSVIAPMGESLKQGARSAAALSNTDQASKAPCTDAAPSKRHGATAKDKDNVAETLFSDAVQPCGLTQKDRKEVIRRKLLSLAIPLRMQVSSKGPRQNKEAGFSEYYLGQCVACVECTRTVGVWWNIGAEATKTNLMVIKAHGKHGKPKEKDGSMLWSAEEMAVVNELLQSSEPVSSRGLKKAFREKGIQTKCENKQINNFVKRTRSNVKALTPHGGTGSPIEVLRMHIDQHVAEQGSWADALLFRVLVLAHVRTPVITQERSYIPFASKGMVNIIKFAKQYYLKMVLDAKQSVLHNKWSILTIGFRICRQVISHTTVRHHGKKVDLEMHTSTMQPFFQAIVSTEHTDNIEDALNDAKSLCSTEAGIDLSHWLIQMHKDYAKGIEAARKKVYANVRAVEDYFHMKQHLATELPPKLHKHRTSTCDDIAAASAPEHIAEAGATTGPKGKKRPSVPKCEEATSWPHHAACGPHSFFGFSATLRLHMACSLPYDAV